MIKGSKSTTLTLTVLLAASLACSASAQPPTATALPPATATQPPTVASTATSTSAPTETPVPTLTPTSTKTATPLPPTHTPTPGPGDILYHTEFDNFSGWKALPLQTNGKMSTEIRGGRFLVQIDSSYTFGYAFYHGPEQGSSDEVVETVAQRVGGTNRNNISLVCRGGEKGWYEFSITSGGLYDILRFDTDPGDYTLLASGGSAAINLQDKPNKIQATCQGDTLSLNVNDQALATTHDSRLTDGGIFGLSVSTFNIGNVGVEFDYFTVSLP